MQNLYYECLPWQEPESVFASLFHHKDNVFWLDSSIAGRCIVSGRVESGLARFSYMGQSYFDIVSDFDIRILNVNDSEDVPFLFRGGWVGYITYEGEGTWLFVDRFLVFDHQERVLYVVGVGEKVEIEEWFKTICTSLRGVKPSLPLVACNDGDRVRFHLARTYEQYLKDIAVCMEYLKRGESYQICLTNTITTEVLVDPFVLYCVLRKKSPVPYGAYIKQGNTAVLCASPEKFLSIDMNGWVEAKPIKGTSKRSENTEEDARLAQELLASTKNRAENMMITDLLRNDVGKVCELGSVSVSKYIQRETYQNVHHLVSTIRGKLRRGMSALDCIRACFPGGSMTGAPKLRTMEILKAIEKKPRGIYSGALGFLSLSGTAEVNIVIRTIIKQGNTLSVGAGGAILIDSDPQQEYDEMILKATPLLEAITEAAGGRGYTIQ